LRGLRAMIVSLVSQDLSSLVLNSTIQRFGRQIAGMYFIDN
jgi:hypothetical protein